MRVLLDLRPALSGRAGIPQECRLLHWGLSQCDGLEVTGMLQSGHAALPWGDGQEVTAAALERALAAPRRNRWWHLVHAVPALARAGWAGAPGVRLPRVVDGEEASQWWPLLFGPTLSPDLARGRLDLRGVPWPWMAAHICGIVSAAAGRAAYPRLDTTGFDVVVVQTPYPGRVSRGSRLVVRYHDAVPLLMTATTRSGRFDARAHAAALQVNVRDGAWFACVSEAARSQLLQVCPQAAPRSVVIPNMLAPAYRPETPDPVKARSVMLARARSRLGSSDPVRMRPSHPAPFMLSVSTIEPRKNQLRLIEAWERLRQQGHPELELVLVGSLGWHTEPILARLAPWIAQGSAHHLENLEPEELRLLYATAAATVCPALEEGFGYTALESMACGGLVVASDIAAHREVCGDAAMYFDASDVTAIAGAVSASLALPECQRTRSRESSGPRRAAAHAVGPTSLRWRDWLRTLS
jgi:hypothetical protein